MSGEPEFRYASYEWPHFKHGTSMTAARFLVCGERLKNLRDGQMYSPAELGINHWLKTRQGERPPDPNAKSLQFRRFEYELYTAEAVAEMRAWAKGVA